MKVKELIAKLSEYDEELDIVIFAKGETYELKAIQIWEEKEEKVLEFGCGWISIEEKKEEL